jgi:hypothetical protein
LDYLQCTSVGTDAPCRFSGELWPADDALVAAGAQTWKVVGTGTKWDRFEYIDYIKIDAQGADFDIIKSAGHYLKDKVVFITAEPESHQYIGCQHNTSENMIVYLKEQNFEKINHPNTQDPTFLNNKFKDLYNKIYIKQL